MRNLLCLTLFGVFVPSVGAAEPALSNAAATTKATYSITGLHCPPCTRTVETSLRKLPGIKSVQVDWKTKSARVEFDERKLSAQKLAQAVGHTSHMMGAGMSYGGRLALKAPEVQDATSAERARQALGKVAGVAQATAYPMQHTVSVQFDDKASTTSQELIDALEKVGIHASNY